MKIFQVMIEQSSVAIVAFDSSDQQGIVWLSNGTKPNKLIIIVFASKI